MGQLPASALCFCMLLHMIIVKHIFQWLSFFVYPWGLGVILLYPCLICGENPQGTSTPVWLYTEYFLCVWHDSFELLSFGLMNHVDTSQLELLWRVNSLDVDNRSCCGLSDVCEWWQACSCRAACIASVLHECFSELYNLSVEICSCLTLSLLDHDCLYQAGLLTICYAVVWQEQSSWILCILVLLLVWVLQIITVCAASGRTTIDYSLVLSQRRDLCW
jgi:hypothetical protein